VHLKCHRLRFRARYINVCASLPVDSRSMLPNSISFQSATTDGDLKQQTSKENFIDIASCRFLELQDHESFKVHHDIPPGIDLHAHQGSCSKAPRSDIPQTRPLRTLSGPSVLSSYPSRPGTWSKHQQGEMLRVHVWKRRCGWPEAR
jgi:hypothetical protein